MTRVLAALIGVATLGLLFRGQVRCYVLRKPHDPQRVPLPGGESGFRCRSCGKTGADLEEMGSLDSGFIRRRV